MNNNKKRTLSGLSETSRRLLKIFGENEIIFEFDKCRKNIKAEKNAIYIKYKRIVAKMEVKLVTKKNKMREKLKKNELMSVREDNNNTVTMTPQDKTDRNEYDNILKVLENIHVLLNRFFIEEF